MVDEKHVDLTAQRRRYRVRDYTSTTKLPSDRLTTIISHLHALLSERRTDDRVEYTGDRHRGDSLWRTCGKLDKQTCRVQ